MIVALLQPARRYDVNFSAKKLLKFVLKVEKIEKRTSLFKFDQKVDVTRLGLFAASYGTEDGNRRTTVFFHEYVDIGFILSQ